jgi:uncharacterized membrane protein
VWLRSLAQNTVVAPPHEIAWESVTGLPNRGRVEFLPSAAAAQHNNRSCTVRLTIGYRIPRSIQRVLSLGVIQVPSRCHPGVI